MPPRRRTTEPPADEAQAATPLMDDEIAHVNAPPREPVTVEEVTHEQTEPAVGPTTPSGVTRARMDALSAWANPTAEVSHAASLAGLLGEVKDLRARLDALDAYVNPTDGPTFTDELNTLGRRVSDNEHLFVALTESVGTQFGRLKDQAASAPRHAILGAIRAIMADVTGVGKHGQMDPAARMGNYKYQRYDDLKRELGAAFRTHAVFVQSTTTNLVNERMGDGGRLSRVVVSVTYRFTSLADGSELSFDSHGESIDKSDKATGKAMTMALKTALVQAFMLAAEDTEDPDATRPGEDDAPSRREPNPDAQRVGREYAVGDTVTVAGQTFVKHSEPADPWGQDRPPDTRTNEEKAQAAADKINEPGSTMADWSKVSDAARQMGLYDVLVKVNGQEMALKHHLVAVGRTLT